MTPFIVLPTRPRRLLAALVSLLVLASLALAQPPKANTALAAAADGEVLLVLVPDQNEARFRAHEQLLGRPLPNEAVGTTRSVSGELVLEPDGTFLPGASRVVIDLRTLRSDQRQRDNYIQQNTLETAQFPTADLVPLQTVGLPLPLPSNAEVAFQIVGDLTVHGVTRQTVWDVAALLGEQEVTGLASTRVRMTDFGMTPPRAGPVVDIDDELTLELQFAVTRTALAGADRIAARAAAAAPTE
jgi:polyisoprenoid-binding protein YceI